MGPSLQKSSSSRLRPEERSEFKVLTYNLVGWWLTDLLLFFFWVVPVAIALFIGVCGLISAHSIKMFKAWWSDQPQEDLWKGKKETHGRKP